MVNPASLGLSAAELAAACAKFVGTIMQRPPAYSAIKVAGQRAYDMARANADFALAARPREGPRAME